MPWQDLLSSAKKPELNGKGIFPLTFDPISIAPVDGWREIRST
jgi:hypothetical protein